MRTKDTKVISINLMIKPLVFDRYEPGIPYRLKCYNTLINVGVQLTEILVKKQQSSFDQVSDFDRGRKVAYRDCGLSFKQIGSSVGRNQTTVMRIFDRWIQEGTTDRPSNCAHGSDDRSVTLRTVAQHIQSVTHHPVSARTIRRRLQKSDLSARRPLLRLPLTQNHRCIRRQLCDERRIWTAEWNQIVFTDESSFCLQHHDGRTLLLTTTIIRIQRRLAWALSPLENDQPSAVMSLTNVDIEQTKDPDLAKIIDNLNSGYTRKEFSIIHGILYKKKL
ncbi:hypothetical protein LAZ67_6003029 [Cordylochernes scorpioides]|uniref:Transposase Tc1-like domain-containing protein n=1 Tax=Cordylochernes scorpioides TaxID=51811 RepID=A0ABY6KL93_9ARAC|nr:hypothetical protein LAZ67_6003029 [Cordylochernes scorpioides]